MPSPQTPLATSPSGSSWWRGVTPPPSTSSYEQLGPSVFGIVRRVIRDPAQSEEVTQEVMLEVWRTASKFDAERGSATAWVMMLAHGRAVDRVSSVQKDSERARRTAAADIPYDKVTEAVESSLERERVRRCLGSLTELQRESVTLAYYRGYTYGQVASLLGVPTGTIKTRMRDALIRLRDCLGVADEPADRADVHTLAGAYAMDAISAPDRARFERHLAGCAACAQEIASLREATARLATATAVPLPSSMKERVMAAAALTRQQPPPVSEDPSTGRARPRGPGCGSRSPAGPAPWPPRPCSRAAVVFGVANGSMRDQLSQAQASSQQIAAVLTAQDATMMTGAVTGGGTVTIVMSHSRHALVFTAADLRALPASRGYELWLIGPAGARPVAMLAGRPRHDRPGHRLRAASRGSSRPHRRTLGRHRPPHRPDDARRRPVTPVHPGLRVRR